MKSLTLILFSTFLLSCGQPSPENVSTNETTQTDQNLNSDETEKIIGTGKITSIADGFDVKIVNLWSTTGEDRKNTGSVTNGEKVNILADEDPYYLIETSNGDGRKGYCMKEFVIPDK